jgi:hypothetical protein
MELDRSDWQDQERAAVSEGIAAWHRGDIQDFDEFDAEFRAANGIREDKNDILQDL